MFRANNLQGVWDSLVVLLSALLAAVVILWGAQSAGEEQTQPKVAVIVSPFDGMFAASGQPGGTPLVSVGSHVDPDSVVGVIYLDVMRPPRKVDVVAHLRGTVLEIFVQDGAPVEAGQALMIVKLDPPDARATVRP